MDIKNLSYTALYEQPVYINWKEGFVNNKCQLIYPTLEQVDTLDIEPVMNYYYALPYLQVAPCRAQDILLKSKVSCIVVNLEDEIVLALSSGGMDMTWNICKAYILLDYYPPFYFCSLPNFAEHVDKTVVQACIFSCKVVLSQAKARKENLEHF